MESKKTFGAYICRRRKELGLTQREFADKLFVTESAVSKWERGMSYPDITLIRDICAILQVSEHELLTASEDVEARTAETLAKKYLRLTRRVRMVQLLLYGGTAVLCLACNWAMYHALTWFWLVLTGVLFLWSQWAWGGPVRLYGAAFLFLGGAVYFGLFSRWLLWLGYRLADLITAILKILALPLFALNRLVKKLKKLLGNPHNFRSCFLCTFSSYG